MTNSIRPGRLVSLPEQGEAQNEPVALRGCVRKRRQGRSGGWRRNVRKARHVKQGDLSGNWEVFMRVPPAPLRRLRPAEEPATQESERP